MSSSRSDGHRRPETLIRWGLVLVSAAIALVVGEIGLRWLVREQPSIRFRQRQENSRRIQRLDIASVIENDTELFWRLAPSRRMPEGSGWARGVISNGQSFREDHEIPRRKRPGETRVLFLGDSCTFGSGLLHDEGFVDRVEKMLAARYPEAAIECINAGVPGYSLFQGWRFLEIRGFDFEPDLVVLTFGWNDRAEWDGVGDWGHFEATRAALPPPALRWSRISRLLWTVWRGRGESGGAAAPRPRLLPAEFQDLLQRVRTSAEKRDVELLLLVWPGRFNVDVSVPAGARTAYQLALYEFGTAESRFGPERGTGYLDLVALAQRLRMSHPPDELFLDPVHATSFFNRQIAAAIVDKVAPWVEAELSSQAD